MPSAHRIHKAPPIQADEWMDLPDERTGDLLRQIRSDNHAFENLRHALEKDFDEVRRTEQDPEWLDALSRA